MTQQATDEQMAEVAAQGPEVPVRTAENRLGTVNGEARLVFSLRDGVTLLDRAACRMPFKVLRPFPAPDGRTVLQLLNISPGPLAGDRYAIDISVEPGAHAIVMSPSATKIHTMPEPGSALQTVRLRVAAGATLEYYPPLNIPFPGACFHQTITAEVQGDGRLAILEAWAAGRIERGERLAFRQLSSQTRCYRTGDGWGQTPPDGGRTSGERTLIYREALLLEPGMPEFGMLEGANYVLSGIFVGPPDAAPEDPVVATLPHLKAGGQTRPGLSVFRALAWTSAELRGLELEAGKGLGRRWGLTPLRLTRFTN